MYRSHLGSEGGQCEGNETGGSSARRRQRAVHSGGYGDGSEGGAERGLETDNGVEGEAVSQKT